MPPLRYRKGKKNGTGSFISAVGFFEEWPIDVKTTLTGATVGRFLMISYFSQWQKNGMGSWLYSAPSYY
jgi:hypothetical protein